MSRPGRPVTLCTEFAYAQTRIQARHGASPGSLQWQALEASHTAGNYLALCRTGALAPWIDGLDETGDAHRIEQHLRERWWHHVDEVALWTPPAWRAAVRCFALLPDLMRLDARQRAAAEPPTTAPRAPAIARTFKATDPRAASIALLAVPRPSGAADDAAMRWSALWRRQLPPEARDVAALRQPAECLLPRLAGATPGRDASSSLARDALRRLFRRHAGSAVAVFAHLALVALDLERLRGGLVVRVLFDGGREPLAA